MSIVLFHIQFINHLLKFHRSRIPKFSPGNNVKKLCSFIVDVKGSDIQKRISFFKGRRKNGNADSCIDCQLHQISPIVIVDDIWRTASLRANFEHLLGEHRIGGTDGDKWQIFESLPIRHIVFFNNFVVDEQLQPGFLGNHLIIAYQI